MKKRAVIFFACFLITLSLCATESRAETIELKNGEIIIGEVKHETEEAVVVSKEDGSFIYSISRDRIKKIRESTPGELKRYKARQSATLVPAKQQVQAAKKARGRIKIKFSEGRFGVVDAVLNGKVRASLYVDTGASVVLISSDIAGQLGIDLEEIKEKITVVLADGRTSTATPITLDSIEVGSSRVKNVKAAVSRTSPGGGIDGLLGMSFLRHFHVKVDSKENCLVLERY
ncbi:MAG: retropepsin-like aspartic protease [Candidatus Omnitrophota bacterium]